jgi:hypothetical protein
MNQRCRDAYRVQLVCRGPKVSVRASTSEQASHNARAADDQRLLARVRELHAASSGVWALRMGDFSRA